MIVLTSFLLLEQYTHCDPTITSSTPCCLHTATFSRASRCNTSHSDSTTNQQMTIDPENHVELEQTDFW